MFFEPFGTADTPQRHQQQSQQGGAQAKESRPETAVDLLGAIENAAGDQSRQSQHNPGMGDGGARSKQR